MFNSKLYGYTIVEVLIVIVLTSIMALFVTSYAIPIYIRNSVKNTAILLSNTYSFAKLEAIRQGIIVYICPVNLTSNDILYDCRNDGNMSNGVLVYARYNSADTYSVPTGQKNENRLKMVKLGKAGNSGGVNVAARNKLDTIYPNGTYFNNLYKQNIPSASQVIQINKSLLGQEYFACIYINPYATLVICYKGDGNCKFPCY